MGSGIIRMFNTVIARRRPPSQEAIGLVGGVVSGGNGEATEAPHERAFSF